MQLMDVKLVTGTSGPSKIWRSIGIYRDTMKLHEIIMGYWDIMSYLGL